MTPPTEGDDSMDFPAPLIGDFIRRDGSKTTTYGPWRVGRSVGRTIYDLDGELIGVMDTPELALIVVTAVNTEAARSHHPTEAGP